MAEVPESTDLAKLEAELQGATAEAKPAAAEPKGKGKGKKKGAKAAKSSQPEVLWTVRVEKAWIILRAQIVEILRGIRSPDPGTRRMSLLFVLSLCGLVGVGVVGLQRMRSLAQQHKPEMTASQQDAKHIGEMFKRTAEENKHKYSLLTIGTFTVQLKPIPNQKQVPGVLNMAEVEIVVECDNKETRNYMEDNLAQARNQITNVFTPLDRDELMTREGKRKMKKMLMEKLNIWLPKGKVEDLFFSKLVLS